jgi:uncharacterized phage protein (TIGR02218 family)
MTRTVPAPLQAALDTGVTTLARAWTVTRRDGLRLGFTDHDRALVFDGVSHEPDSGFTAQAVEQATGLAVDTHSVEGALRSSAISDADLERGLYDGAEILFWLVDWSAPDNRLLQARGRIGEVRRGAHAFEAEIAGLAEAVNQPQGRRLARSCPRRLGDAGCGVDLSTPGFEGSGTVAALVSERVFETAGLTGFESRWFDRGALTWTSGANAGTTGHVKAHRRLGGTVTLSLWQAPGLAIAEGDAFTVTAGCDKSFGTCAAKFANGVNFGGFPHMPGEDWAAGYPNTGEGHDGGSLFRG